jgi:hypothetical protein
MALCAASLAAQTLTAETGKSQLRRTWQELENARTNLRDLAFDDAKFRRDAKRHPEKARAELLAYREAYIRLDAAETAYDDAQIALSDEESKAFECSAACVQVHQLEKSTLDAEIDGTRLNLKDIDDKIAAHGTDPKSIPGLKLDRDTQQRRLKELTEIRATQGPDAEHPGTVVVHINEVKELFREARNEIPTAADHRRAYFDELEGLISDRPWLVGGQWTAENLDTSPSTCAGKCKPGQTTYNWRQAKLTVRQDGGELRAVFLYNLNNPQWDGYKRDYHLDCNLSVKSDFSWQGKWTARQDEGIKDGAGTLSIEAVDATLDQIRIKVVADPGKHIFPDAGKPLEMTVTLTRQLKPEGTAVVGQHYSLAAE